MIKTKKLDLSEKDYLLYHQLILKQIKTLKTSSKDIGYNEELCGILRTIFPLDFIILLGNDIYYNIQTKKQFVWIFLIGNVSVIVYKPRPLAFPTFQHFEVFSSEDRQQFFNQEIFDFFEIKKNTFDKDLEQVLKEYLIIFFNKFPENTVTIKNEQIDTIVYLLKNIKTLLFSKSKSYFLHYVIVPKKQFAYRIPEEDLMEETKIIDLEFQIKGKGKKMNLLIFEKKGKNDSFFQRCLARWKEFFVFFFMFLLLVTLSVCNSEKADKLGPDVDFVCRNKSSFLFTFGLLVIGFVLLKHFARKKK
jgi:hypothetical protein